MADIDDIISKDALKSVNDLQATFNKIVTTLDKLIEKSKSLDVLLSAMNKVSGAQNKVKEVSKEALNISAQLANQEDEVVKAKIRYAKANKEQRDTLATLMTLEDKEAGTLEKLAARNKQLREEQRKLNLETAEGVKRNKEINAEINKNTKFIKDNSDSLVKNKMNVGNYTESIKDAVGALTGFASISAAALAVLNKLKEAFLQTEGGEKFRKQISEMSRTLFQGIVTKPGRAIASALGIGSATQGIEKEMALSAAFAARWDQIRKGDRKDLVEIERLNGEITQLRLKAADYSLTEKENADATAAILQKEAELIAYQLADKQKELDLITNVGLKIRKDDTELLDRQAQLTAEIAAIQNSQSVRLYTKDQAAREKLQKAQEKAREDAKKQAEEDFENEISLKNARFKVSQEIDSQEFDFKVEQSDAELQLIIEQTDAEIEIQKQKFDEEIRLTQETEREKAKLKQELVNNSFELLDTLIDRRAGKQLADLQKQQDTELKMAGDNEEQKQKIAEKYEKRKADIQRKAARTEKATALFQIAIDTGKAIVANLKTPLLLPWVIATAAVQAAMVAARPIPQYAKGILSSGSGPAIVGEMGSELMIGPDGRVSLSGSSAELVNLERGTRIIPSDETKMIMAAASSVRNGGNDTAIERRHKELIRAINEKESLILPSTVGQPITMRKGNLYKTYFNRHLQ